MINIETDRLIIRDHIEEDMDSLHNLLSDEKAMHYLSDIKTSTLDESKQNLYEAIKESHLENRTKYFFAIIEKATNNYIGEIGYTVVIDCPYGKVVNLGYFILPIHWGKGFVTEAARAVMDYAFTSGNVIKIETGCIKENVGSERVMKKVGMIKEAEFVKHVLLHSKLYDRVEYRLLKEEWEKLEGRENER
jgi:[ribosomal protein S5]-alanine N-acetyltransferase